MSVTSDHATPSRHAAVLGSPIGHSRSPDLHLAAYRALGLDWDYRRIECDAAALPGVVAGLDDSWVGLSVTMPGKVAALEVADTATTRCRQVGSANTLVHRDGRWHADCTDIDGVTGALVYVRADQLDGASAVLLGAGGTARPALAALSAAGVGSVTVVVRDPARASDICSLAEELEVSVTVRAFVADDGLRALAAEAAVTVSTVPADAAEPLCAVLSQTPALVDAIYAPWPTPLAAAVGERGGEVAGGLVMLLNQAFAQVELFTGHPAPRAAMAAALDP